MGIYFNSRSSDAKRGNETSKLVPIYEQITASKGGDFEVVFVSFDKNEEDFNAYFATMPWLAIPFSDAEDTWRRILVFSVISSAYLIIIGPDGKVQTEKGVDLVLFGYGADAYPFTPESFNFVKEQYEEAKRNQSLTSLLVSSYRDYLLSNNGNRVKLLVFCFFLFHFSRRGDMINDHQWYVFCRFQYRNLLGRRLSFISIAVGVANTENLLPYRQCLQ